MALQELQADSEYEVAALLTTVTEDYDRISMHGDFNRVRSVPAKPGDDAGVINPLFVKTGTKGFGVAPAILKEDESRLPAEAVFLSDQVLRRRG